MLQWSFQLLNLLVTEAHGSQMKRLSIVAVPSTFGYAMLVLVQEVGALHHTTTRKYRKISYSHTANR